MTTKLDTNKTGWSYGLIGRIVISQIAHAMTPEQQDAFHKARAGRDDKSIELKFTIDGIETDFESWINRVDQDYERQLVEAAGSLLKERLGEATEKMVDAANEFVRGMRAEAAKLLGYNPWESD